MNVVGHSSQFILSLYHVPIDWDGFIEVLLKFLFVYNLLLYAFSIWALLSISKFKVLRAHLFLDFLSCFGWWLVTDSLKLPHWVLVHFQHWGLRLWSLNLAITWVETILKLSFDSNAWLMWIFGACLTIHMLKSIGVLIECVMTTHHDMDLSSLISDTQSII